MTEQTIWVAPVGHLPVQVRVLWEDEAGMMVQPVSANDGPRFYADRDQIVTGAALEDAKRHALLNEIKARLTFWPKRTGPASNETLRTILILLESNECTPTTTS